MIFIHNFLACCVIPHATKWTLSNHVISFLSVIRIQSFTWTTSIIIILCPFFSLFMMDMDGTGCFVCPDRENTFAEGCFWSSYVVFCSQKTEVYPWWHLWIYVYYHLKSFQSHCHLDLCFQWREVEQLLHLVIASLLKRNRPVFAKLLHTVADWKAPR